MKEPAIVLTTPVKVHSGTTPSLEDTSRLIRVLRKSEAASQMAFKEVPVGNGFQ